MSVAPAVDAITLEVVRNRLEAIVEEMGVTMLKTAHSPIFYESKDYSVALFSLDAELLAMGQFIPHHQGGMAAALDAILAIYPVDSMAEGDVYLINDSYLGGTHTQDFNVLSPIFVDGIPVCFAGCIAHQMDVGGMVAGGYTPTAREIFQEGIRFPGIKLFDKGRPCDDVMRMIKRNVRLPDQQMGDLLGQVAALRVAWLRVPDLVRRYGSDRFRGICADILDITERRVRAEIEKLPNGAFEVIDYHDHDGNTPTVYTMKLTMTVDDSEITFDFAGTDPEAPGFINASFWNTRASTIASMMLFLDPEIPRNHGFFRPLTVMAPEGTLLNPRYPAPVSGSTTECGGRVYDLCLRALSLANGEKGIGTWSMMWAGLAFDGIHPRSGRRFIHWVLDGLGTGGGARAHEDGWNASNIAASNCLIPNVEMEEETYPCRYLRRELKADSGGAGRFRGGLALETELMIEVDCNVTAFASRVVHPPQGIYGGGPGGPAVVTIRDADGNDRDLEQKFVDQPIKAGETVVLRACGGGGYGDPLERTDAAILDDLAAGFVTEEGLAAYGRAGLARP
jgi:N-methylhydantoinase B